MLGTAEVVEACRVEVAIGGVNPVQEYIIHCDPHERACTFSLANASLGFKPVARGLLDVAFVGSWKWAALLSISWLVLRCLFCP